MADAKQTFTSGELNGGLEASPLPRYFKMHQEKANVITGTSLKSTKACEGLLSTDSNHPTSLIATIQPLRGVMIMSISANELPFLVMLPPETAIKISTNLSSALEFAYQCPKSQPSARGTRNLLIDEN